MASCQFTHQGRTFKLTVTETSYSIPNNTSDVKWEITISGSGGVWNTSYCKATVNGSVVFNATKDWSTAEFPAKDGTVSGTITGIGHNADGKKTISFALEGYSNVYTTQSADGSLTLTNIPRYFSKNPTLELVSKTATTATMKWTTSETCSTVQYRLGDNGSWVDVVADANAKSGQYTISGLSPATTYKIYGDNKRKDSGQWAQTKPYVSVTTLGYASITKFQVTATTANTATFTWAASKACDAIEYSLNGGGWKGGSYPDTKISGLSSNTTYKLKIRVKAQDSQLWTTSNEVSFKTLAFATITAANNFTDEENPAFTFTNPSNLPMNIYLEYSITGNIYSKQIIRNGISNTGQYTFSLTEDERNLLRKEDINNSRLTVRYSLHSWVSDEENWSTKDMTMTIVNANPIFEDFEWEVTNYNELTGDDTKHTVIEGYSNVKTIISEENKAIPQKFANIKSYQTNIGSLSNSTTNITYPVEYSINKVVGAGITVFANDTRSFSKALFKPIENYIAYKPLDNSPLEVARTEQVNSEVRLHFEGRIDIQNFGAVTNSIKTAKYYYKDTSSNENYVEGNTILTPTLTQVEGTIYNYEIDQIIRGDLDAEGFDINNSFLIKIVIEDELSKVEDEATLGTGSPAIAVHKNCVALGAPYNESLGGRVQINGELPNSNVKNEYNTSNENVYSSDYINNKAIVKINNESVSSPKVEFKKSKNLLYTPYTSSNKLTATATRTDHYWQTTWNCYLEAGKQYTFSCEASGSYTNGNFEVYFLKDGAYNYYFVVNGNVGTFTPSQSGTFYIRYDVNTSGTTVSAWNFQVEPGSQRTSWQQSDIGNAYVRTENGAMTPLFNRPLLDLIYPIGSIYLSTNSTDPKSIFGGTWELLKDKFLVGAGSAYGLGSTGGNSMHNHSTGSTALVVNQMPKHRHTEQGYNQVGGGVANGVQVRSRFVISGDPVDTVMGEAGGGQGHSHGNTGNASTIPPYLAVNMWKRTA